MRSGETRYPVDRYLDQNSQQLELVNLIDDDIWNPEPALRPEDEIMLRKLHEMLQSTADDLKLLSGELSKYHETGVQTKTLPTPMDEEFNEKVHIEEVVNAKFHGYKIIDKTFNVPDVKLKKDALDDVKLKNNNSNNKTKTLNNSAEANKTNNIKKPVTNRNLGLSRIRVMHINSKEQDSVKPEKLNNGKVINSSPAVGYNEFIFKHVEPKVEVPRRKLQVQNMPSINIRSELKHQQVLQLDIVPDTKEVVDDNKTSRSNVSVVAVRHETETKPAPVQQTHQTHTDFKLPSKESYNNTVRKISKMSSCESSGSTNNVSSDTKFKLNTQKRIISSIRNSPKASARSRRKNVSNKIESENRPRLNLDEWKKKLNQVYGASTSKKAVQKSTKNPNATKKSSASNNAQYIPYSKLTLGGVSISDIEREIPDLPDKSDIPLSPLLDKILSRENSFHSKSPRKLLTTSDENLLEEVMDLERSVNETLAKNVRKTKSPVVEVDDNSDDSGKKVEESESYADDFEEDNSNQSVKSENDLQSEQDSSDNVILDINPPSPKESIDSQAEIETKDNQNTTYTKASNLSYKDTVDIFEFIHAVDTQDTATQSNATNKISPKETQTSPLNDNQKIQPIHNDLWPTIDPRKEVEKMFEMEKEFIKKLIIEEYGDLLEKSINKPSTSNENKQDDVRRNITAMQKNTQTSPAHVKSVMTSPRTTKTRTTSPFHLTVPVHQTTSPMILAHDEDIRTVVNADPEDLTMILSSPRFSLRLPQNSQEVLSNIGDKLTPAPSKSSLNFRAQEKTVRTSSSSSVDADNSSSDLSSLGEIKMKRKLRKQLTSSESSTSTVSKYSIDLHSVGILPLRSEGEVSLGQVSRKKATNLGRSDGETSLGPR